jgi:hypothetical protein
MALTDLVGHPNAVQRKNRAVFGISVDRTPESCYGKWLPARRIAMSKGPPGRERSRPEGVARVKQLTREERSAIARKAGAGRWE